MLAASPAQTDQETTCFNDTLDGPKLQDGWQWVRQDDTVWNFGSEGLELAFSSSLFPPLLLRALGGANACEVTLTMPPMKGDPGEQAGLVWYSDDDHHVKLVVEWAIDGTARLALTRNFNSTAETCATAILDDEEAFEPKRLRLELSADGRQLSGVVVGPYYSRLIGSCSVDAKLASRSDDAISIGICAHGGLGAMRKAHFSQFIAVAVRPNRVQWNTTGVTRVPENLVQAPEIGTQATLGRAGYSESSSVGLTISPHLSEEERNRVTSLLQAVSLETPSPPVDVGAGLTISPNLSEEDKAKVAAMLMAVSPAELVPSDEAQPATIS